MIESAGNGVCPPPALFIKIRNDFETAVVQSHFASNTFAKIVSDSIDYPFVNQNELSLVKSLTTDPIFRTAINHPLFEIIRITTKGTFDRPTRDFSRSRAVKGQRSLNLDPV